MSLYFALFLAGVLTILLPCILPLLPIVLGVSIAGRSRLRPLFTIAGMVVSFIAFTFLLLVVLHQFVEVADYIRLGTYAVLFLFGIGFLFSDRRVLLLFAVFGGLFFYSKGWIAVAVAVVLCIGIVAVAGRVGAWIQNLGLKAQMKTRSELGADAPLSAFIVGLTLGLVWVPCAGPALSFALTLVRDEPGLTALLALLSYALGTAVPLILIGYGGQYAVHSVRSLSQYSGRVKQVSGLLLVATAIMLQFRAFEAVQIWLLEHTSFGDIGTRIEQRLFVRTTDAPSSDPSPTLGMSTLPKLSRAPEFSSLGPWHNAEPFTMESLRGKVVLVDFWTYSCINCIRTLPYIQGYWDTFKDSGKFVLLGVHTPEFTFEKSQKNVALAIKEHGLTYPVAQDNEFGTWNAFSNHYWPAKYLIDANGYIRYTHFGEGSYEETAKAIESLLQEAGVETSEQLKENSEKFVATFPHGDVTSETYLSSRSWPAFGNTQGEPTSAVISYQAPTSLVLSKYYLVGDWQLVDDESETLRSNTGEIRMKFSGGEINLVLGIEEGAKPVSADVFIDGVMTKTITVDHHDLYQLFKGDYGEHEMILKFKSKGVQAFAFTFGG